MLRVSHLLGWILLLILILPCENTKRLKEQLTLPRNQEKPVTIFDATPHNACCEENVVCMQKNLQDSNVLVAVCGRDLQALDGTPATPEQQRDLIAFRDIGQQYYESYVK